MTRTTKIAAALVALTAITALAFGNANAGIYVGGGTIVYKEQGRPPAADNGTLVCHSSGALGFGGGCIPFHAGAFVSVTDLVHGTNVAFQVCIDNDGDGICTDAGKRDPVGSPCADAVFFSHDDQGLFHNPLGPLPTAMRTGCGATAPWKGYIVFLCEGVHSTRDGSATPVGGAHTHPATQGVIAPAGPLAPSGFGDFCGAAGGEQPVRKPYIVI